MAHSAGEIRTVAGSAPVGIVFAALVALLAPGASFAQSSQTSEKGIYVGGSLGVYYESSEGKSGHAFAGSGIIGYRFNARWVVQGEFGATGTVYCSLDVPVLAPDGSVRNYLHPVVPKGNPPKGAICHSDPVLNLDLIRRFTVGSLHPSLALGVGAGLHLGAAVEIPLGRRFALAPGIDLNAGPEFGGARPRVALLIRF